MRSMTVAAVLLVAGCSSTEPAQTGTSVAMLSQSPSGSVSVAFTTSDNLDQLPSVLAGTAPRTFHWVMVTVNGQGAIDARSTKGFSGDLSSATSSATFTQVYEDVCNPAKSNFSRCWLYENYTSGDAGLSGSIQLQVGQTEAVGSFDVTWEGQTDRFGDPVQYYKHGTISGYSATIEGTN